MRAAVAVAQDFDSPLSCLKVSEIPEPEVPPGWARVRVRAAGLNPHDLWTLRGVGHSPKDIPMTLGCEGAGTTDDGRQVLIYPIIADPLAGDGDETLDPRREILSERHDGTFAEYVVVPASNLIPLPKGLTLEQGAAIGITYGTAYRMLFTQAGVRPGDRVLVQGGAGGVGSAAVALASAAGCTVYATARTDEKRAYALECGATAVFEDGARLPERVDVVVDSVGEATWKHSLRSVRPGGTIVLCGATTGGSPDPELQRVFFQQLRIIGSTACTRAEFGRLIRMIGSGRLRLPERLIDRVLPLERIHEGFEALASGEHLGKIVVTL